ncbi:putative tRNA pseudouridine synthase Pus10 [Stylophora pistillata]|uniref:tRNA pseudouridine(55) synthase n=2 Tax=Stylophora pistillata TaxID=50429 RepID=A0A2B4SHS7_STYPI|nr:putative tRNA pseudouridine synthase Pus10 [Stylophora pistillata]
MPCCPRCILRLLGERNIDLYQDSVEREMQSICVACLGILEKSTETAFLDKIQSAIRSSGHQFESFMFAISVSHSLTLRQHSLSIFLQENYSSAFDSRELDEIPRVKDVFKWVHGPKLEERLQVNYKALSPFKILLDFTHRDADREVEFLNDSSKSRLRHRRKRHKIENKPEEGRISSSSVNKALAELTTVDRLKRVTDCPPKSPQFTMELSQITCAHDSIYIAGRYNKYSRTLPQTPWLIDNVRLRESSVEEKICDLVTAKVRCDGRPFLVELINPRLTRLKESFFIELQKEINFSHSDIAIRNLQQVTKEQCLVLKDAETNKTKTYKALIWTENEITDEQLQKLNGMKDVKIYQKTPLRVLHRRPLAVRERYIFSMTAERIDSNHWNLFLKTQAGTYVKEFVHGDFGRTKPSLGDLLHTETDILELDVESVDVDWPPKKDLNNVENDKSQIVSRIPPNFYT